MSDERTSDTKVEEEAKAVGAAGSTPSESSDSGAPGQGADVTDLRSRSEDAKGSVQPEPARARSSRGWPIAALVLLLLLVGSLALNWRLFRGGNALADEASGLGVSLSAANQRADRAEQSLEDLQGVVGDVHHSVLSLQHALGELATVTASVSAPAEPLAAVGESGVDAGEAVQKTADETSAVRAPGEGGALASVESEAEQEPVTLASEVVSEGTAAARDPKAAAEAGPVETAVSDVAAGPDEESPSLFRRVIRGTRDKLRGLWPN